MTRIAVVVAGIVALVLAIVRPGLSAHPAAAAVSTPAAGCATRSLSGLGGPYSDAIAVSSTGGYVAGTAVRADGRSVAVLWRPTAGAPVEIATGLRDAVVAGVNARGAVVGVGTDPRTGERVGWWARGDHVVRLAVPAGMTAQPEAIDDAGLVVGVVVDQEAHADDAMADAPEQAVLWRAPSRAPVRLAPLPGDVGAHAFAVSPRGIVAGVSEGGSFRPVVWNRKGRPVELPTLGGGWGVVRWVDDTGRATGDSGDAAGRVHAVLWSSLWSGPRSVAALHDLAAGGQGEAVAAGPGGAAYGTSGVADAPSGSVETATRWVAGMPRILRPAAGAASARVNAAAGGLAVGYSVDARGGRHATVWACGR